MSIEVSTRVWKQSKQKGTHKLFLLALADHANGDGYCYPGIERISDWCNVNDRQGRRISADLQEAGQIFVKVGGGRNGTNEYLIAVGMLSEEIEATLAKYFGASRKEAFEITQNILEKQHKAEQKNPVLDTPPVTQDQNPVMQGINPVLEDSRTVINHQEPHTQSAAPKNDAPETPSPKQQALESLEKVFFQYGGTLSGALIQRFYLVYDANTDHPAERLQYALKRLGETRNFFKAMDGYREWHLPKPEPPPNRPYSRKPQRALPAPYVPPSRAAPPQSEMTWAQKAEAYARQQAEVARQMERSP